MPVRVDWERGERHLFWCPVGIRQGLRLQENVDREATERCPECWKHYDAARAARGGSVVYLIWRAPGSREVYVGEAKDAEHRFYTHFMYGNVPFLPPLSEYEEMVRRGDPAPFYEVIATFPSKAEAKAFERRRFAELREEGYTVSGGR